MNLCLSEHSSPLGPYTVVTRGEALCVLAFSDRTAGALVGALSRRYPDRPLSPGSAPRAVESAFEAYWSGDIRALDALSVEAGGTPFQAHIWATLREIPVGETISYAELSRRVGRSPGASRAVGAANGANPISLVIPCHRVIRGDGDLCGYAGGVERKRWLLTHEGAKMRAVAQSVLAAL